MYAVDVQVFLSFVPAVTNIFKNSQLDIYLTLYTIHQSITLKPLHVPHSHLMNNKACLRDKLLLRF